MTTDLNKKTEIAKVSKTETNKQKQLTEAQKKKIALDKIRAELESANKKAQTDKAVNKSTGFWNPLYLETKEANSEKGKRRQARNEQLEFCKVVLNAKDKIPGTKVDLKTACNSLHIFYKNAVKNMFVQYTQVKQKALTTEQKEKGLRYSEYDYIHKSFSIMVTELKLKK